MLHLSDRAMADLVASPFAAAELVDPDGPVVVVAHAEPRPPQDAPRHDTGHHLHPWPGAAVDRLRSLPCVVLADGPEPATPVSWADVVIDRRIATLDEVLATVEANPIAATTCALVLRGADGRTRGEIGDGLVAESMAYSTLQAGAEFARWRTQRPRRDRPDDGRPPVRIERVDDRLEVVLDRPAVHNALNTAMRDALLKALLVAAVDPAIAQVVLRGAGPTFCSGGDLDEFGSFVDPATAHVARLAGSIGRAIDAVADRTTAYLHGSCAGSGIELPAFAGRVVADPATTFALPEVGLGLLPGAGGTVSLPRRIGRWRTALLCLAGRAIDADTALSWGLVDAVEPVSPAEPSQPSPRPSRS